jgi:hypothetical protein
VTSDRTGGRSRARTPRRLAAAAAVVLVTVGVTAAFAGTAAAAATNATVVSPSDVDADGTVEVRSAASAQGASTVRVSVDVTGPNASFVFDDDGDFSTTGDQGANGTTGAVTVTDGGVGDLDPTTGSITTDLVVSGAAFAEGGLSLGVSEGASVGTSPEQTVTTLAVDDTAPTIVETSTDDDGERPGTSLDGTESSTAVDDNGRIDTIEVVFSEPVDDATVSVADFAVDGYTIDEVTTGSGGDDDDTIILELEEKSTPDTGATPQVDYTAGSLADEAGNLLGSTSETPVDDAAPRIVDVAYEDADGDARIDQVNVTASETVQPVSNLGQDDLTFADVGDFTGAAFGTGTDDVVTAATTTVTVPLGTESTAVTTTDSSGDLAVSVVAGNGFRLRDAAGNQDTRTGAVPTAEATYTDGAAPVRVGLASRDVDADGQVDAIDVNYSEPLASGIPESGDYTLGGADAGGVSKAGVTKPFGPTVRLGLAGAPANDTSLSLELGYGAGGSLPDVSDGNQEADSFPLTAVDDGAPPRFAAVTTGDADADGRVDELTVRFTEDVAANSVEAADLSVGSANGLAAGTTVASVAGDDGDANVTVSLSPGGGFDTNATPTLSYAEDGGGEAVVDTAPAANAMVDQSSAPATDGAAPVAVAGAYRDDDGDGQVDTAAVTYSEAVAATSTASTVDWAVTTAGSVGLGAVTAASFGSSDTVELAVAGTAGVTGGPTNPAVSYAGTNVSDGTNDATAATVSLADGAAPVVASASSLDTDGDGTVDEVRVVHTEDVSPSAPEAGDYDFGGADGGAIATAGGTTVAGETVTLAVTGPAGDTGLSASLNYTATAGAADSVVDGDGNAAPSASGVTVADAAGPSIVSATTRGSGGAVTTVEVTFSEAVDDATVGTGDFSLGQGGVGAVSHPAGTDDDTAVLSVSGNVPQDVAVTLAAASVSDTGGTVGPTGGNTVTASDGVGPALVSATTVETTGNDALDEISVTFGEAVDDTTLSAGEFSLSSGQVTGVDTGSTVNDSTVVLDVRNAGGTAATPTVTVAAGNVTDLSGNPVAADSSVVAADGAGPVLVAAEIPRRGQIRAEFSEPLDDDASTLTNDSFAVQPGRVDGVDTGTADDDTVRLNVSRIGQDTVTVLALAGGVVDADGNAAVNDSSVTVDVDTPDRTVVNITSAPTSVVAGETVTVEALVESVGEFRARQDVELRVDGDAVDETRVSLAPGDSTTVSLSWETNVSDAGERRIQVATPNDADGRNLTVEESAANLSFVGFEAPGEVERDGSLTANVSVRNTGSTTGNATVEYRLDADGDGLLDGSETLASTRVSVPAGATVDATLSATVTAAAGTYTHGAVLGNETRTATLNVTEPAPVNETTATVTADPDVSGERATHTVEIVVGDASAGDSLNGVEVDYSAGSAPADASDVGQGDVTVAVGGTDVTGDVDSVDASNGGETLTVGLGGTTTPAAGETVTVTLADVGNPTVTTETTSDVAVSLNPQSDPVDTAVAAVSYRPATTLPASVSIDDQTTAGTNATVSTYDLGPDGRFVSVWTVNASTGTPETFLGTVRPANETGADLVVAFNATTLTRNATVVAAVHDADPTTAETVVASDTASLTFEPFASPVPGSGGAAPPNDLDGDGLFEDVDGDGDADFDDAISLAFAQFGQLDAQQTAALDFDGDGDVDFDDAIELAFQV